jgi:hypothetical protein
MTWHDWLHDWLLTACIVALALHARLIWRWRRELARSRAMLAEANARAQELHDSLAQSKASTAQAMHRLDVVRSELRLPRRR